MSNTIDWGKIHYSSWSPETNLTGTGGSSFSNTQSIYLDGMDAYVGGSTTYSQLDGATALTISFWAKSTSETTSTVIHIGQSTNRQIFVNFLSSRIIFRKNENTDSTYLRADTAIQNAGNWNHIMICMDLSASASLRGDIFLNGNNVTAFRTLDTNAIQTSTGNLYLNETYKDFTGNIDEVAIWSGTDLRNDVATIYNSGVPNDLNNNGLTAPTSWYRCGDGDSSPTLTDNGTSSYNLTMNNFSTFSTDVPT